MATGGSPAAECGTLRGSAQSRSRSYGSTARGPAIGQRHLEHRPRPGDTLQGLALRYGVSTEQIKRANRLYTNDSIFLKESIRIPAAKQEVLPNGMKPQTVPGKGPGEAAGSGPCASQQADDRLALELTPADFLKRLDSKISQSKAAAIRKLKEGGTGYEGAEGRPSTCSSDPVLVPRRGVNPAGAPGPRSTHKNHPGHHLTGEGR